MAKPPLAPPGPTRRLGRSRRYTGANLPARLRQWHAPRANRWEYLCVMAGALDTEWLDTARVTTRHLAAGEQCWIAPGMRWRVAGMGPDAGFELEVHADETVAAAAPQDMRAALLEHATRAAARDAGELEARLAALATGQSCLLRIAFDAGTRLREIMHASGDTLFWHPLAADARQCTALVVRSAAPVGLAEYMGRDHAVIESALAGALRGHAEQGCWLRHALARHLAIEEDLLFPAWLGAGGRDGWVRGLLNEHRLLRRYLPQLDDATARRRFLLLLDGHDEKEERIIYPDIVAKLGANARELARTAMRYPSASESA